MIVYATQPDNVALDGSGQRNSPFTTALLKHIATPGLQIESVMKRVRTDVMAATRNKQIPWDHSALNVEVILVPTHAASPSQEPATTFGLTPPVYVARPTESASRADSVDAVRAFYAALSQADGYAAAALIVPEKRGTRNFDATEMTKFWSSLRQRLRVQRIEALDDDVVADTYNYVGPTGKSCDANATVKTIRSGGRTLIQGISANC